MYVVSPEFLTPVNKDQLKSLFALTEAESHVCSLFAQNKPLKEIAVLEGKSVNTVREQLQNSYVKTNTKNQLELINLLASLPVTN
jgi:DNA-binding CsgD family transcriptional regulator